MDMKHVHSLIILFLSVAGTSSAASPLLERLQRVKAISNIQPVPAAPYAEAYAFDYEQRVDHERPERGTFRQRVTIGHRDFHAPVVAVLEGYGGGTLLESELSSLFTTNQVTIEHRFFGTSVPATGIPWKSLTIALAAADHHEIIQALRREVYPGTRWISTGISKGGQATIFHRYFYPRDVEASLPYVAPFNLARVDPRLGKFLARLGNTPGQRNKYSLVGSGGQETAIQIFRFQEACFKRLDRMLPLLEELAADNGFTFERAGGSERALKLIILEYPFAFWQWGGNVGKIPEVELEETGELFRYLVGVSSPDFFSDRGILAFQPFYYAAFTEIGMYAYDLTPFRAYFKNEPDRQQIDFRFTLPEGEEIPPFNEEQMRRINRWLQSDAEKMLFIYGGQDPWSATAVDLKNNDKCKKFVKADANHACRVNSFESIVREDIIDTIAAWLNGQEEKSPGL
ncbi:MAG: peptidase [Odoribacteraceae bacterium]|jgi:hypothetical protein|nr:peptidase [Odoribacteraceae bacterium]